MNVFVDGQYGTTGLKIQERLLQRHDVNLLSIPEARKKDPDLRVALMNDADVVFLCLPDEAAREAVALIENPRTKVIDSSTAFRTNDAWVYGLPELSRAQRGSIAGSSRVSVPGCHATGFVLAVQPLVQQGILPRDYPVTSHSLTGYSGGGRTLIEQYEGAGGMHGSDGERLMSPQHYSLNLNHKHLPEMKAWTGLTFPPVFLPTVGPYYKGMVVTVPFITRLMQNQPRLCDIHAALSDYYQGERFVRVAPLAASAGIAPNTLDPTRCNGTNTAEIHVLGNDDQVLVACRLDNLGKGSSGAAVQCMNIMMELDEGVGITS